MNQVLGSILIFLSLMAPSFAQEVAALPAAEARPAGTVSSVSTAQVSREFIIISGGPALRTWENAKRHPHDNIWQNFINAAEVRWKQLKAQARPGDVLTWLIYRPGYERRGKEDGSDPIASIKNRAKALGVNAKWFDSGQDVIAYLNEGFPRDSVKIVNLDYFGHSNRNCWMFDYSNSIDGCSSAYLHNENLKELQSGSFEPDAHVKSWGCHSAESFTQQWKRYAGVSMIGTVGKTDYSTGGLPVVTRARGWSNQ